MHVLYELLLWSGSEINGGWGKNATKLNKNVPEIQGDGSKNAPFQLKFLILILTIWNSLYNFFIMCIYILNIKN